MGPFADKPGRPGAIIEGGKPDQPFPDSQIVHRDGCRLGWRKILLFQELD
jgi:hypothetical protein